MSHHSDPVTRFQQLWAEAREATPYWADAMTLATVTAEGRPAARTVLLKSVDARGFVFHTNYQSRKGEELRARPWAALCLHWSDIGVQVRVEGRADPVPAEESDAYWATRPRASRIGAWASDQSRPLADRDTLLARVTEFERRYADTEVPRPPHWGGYRVVPDRIEFWHDHADRLHDRFLYEWTGDAWQMTRLYP